MRPCNALTAFALILTTGCSLGTSLKDYAPAQQAGGARVTLTVGRQKLVGELIALEDTTLMLATARDDSTTRLVRVPLVAFVSLAGPGWRTQPWDEKDREALRLLARYPAGITPQLERRLAVAYGGDAVRLVSR